MAADSRLNHSCHAHKSCTYPELHVLLFASLYSAFVLKLSFFAVLMFPDQLIPPSDLDTPLMEHGTVRC
jgi:hypothetical protein